MDCFLAPPLGIQGRRLIDYGVKRGPAALQINSSYDEVNWTSGPDGPCIYHDHAQASGHRGVYLGMLPQKGEMSLMVRFSTKSIDPNIRQVILANSQGYDYTDYALVLHYVVNAGQLGMLGGQTYFGSTARLVADQWYTVIWTRKYFHLTGIWRNSLYIDGVLDTNGDWPYPLANGAIGDTTLGAFTDGGGGAPADRLWGSTGAVGIWSRLLTDEEIRILSRDPMAPLSLRDDEFVNKEGAGTPWAPYLTQVA